MNGEVLPRGAPIEIPLDRVADRIGMGLVGCFFLGLPALVLLDPKAPLGAVLFLFLLCGGFYFWMLSGIAPCFGGVVSFTPRQVELRRWGKRVFSAAWAEIEGVYQPEAVLGKKLQFRDRNGRTLGVIPIGNLNHRLPEFLGVLHAHLPPNVEMRQVPSPRRGTRGARAARAVAAFVGTGITFGIAMASLDPSAPAWVARTGGWCLFAFLVLLVVALAETSTFLRWNRPSPPRVLYVPANDLRTALAGIAAGAPVYRPRTFVYPDRLRRFNVRADAALTMAILIGISLCIAIGVLFGAYPVFLKQPLAGLALAALGFVFLPPAVRFSRKYIGQMKDLGEGFTDEIVVEGKAIWVVRGGRRFAAMLQEPPRINPLYRSQNGLNAFRMALEVDGRVAWYDPSCMVELSARDEGGKAPKAP